MPILGSGLKKMGGLGSSGRSLAAFTQSLGAELLTNNDFTTWAAGDPSNWTVSGEVGSDPEISQVAAANLHGGGGTGAANWFSSATASQPRLDKSGVLSASVVYLGEIDLSAYSSGICFVATNNGDMAMFMLSAVAVARSIYRPIAGLTYRIRPVNAPADFTVNTISHKAITLNAAQVMPADDTITFNFTLPASPIAGQIVGFYYRINSAGDEHKNCWMAYIQRNAANSGWTAVLDSISAGVITSRIAPVACGSPDALRVVTSGNNHSLYTGASAVFTQRGTTISNSAFAAATGLTPIYDPAATATLLTW